MRFLNSPAAFGLRANGFMHKAAAHPCVSVLYFDQIKAMRGRGGWCASPVATGENRFDFARFELSAPALDHRTDHRANLMAQECGRLDSICEDISVA